MNLVFHISEDGSEIELKHCASSKTSVKSSRKYFVHLNWIRLATNPSWFDSSIGRAVVYIETRRCKFESRSRQRIFRCRLQCQINMNLVFHIVRLRILPKVFPSKGRNCAYVSIISRHDTQILFIIIH